VPPCQKSMSVALYVFDAERLYMAYPFMPKLVHNRTFLTATCQNKLKILEIKVNSTYATPCLLALEHFISNTVIYFGLSLENK
jgi:hypothetical protein